jgi:hypothetical protein
MVTRKQKELDTMNFSAAEYTRQVQKAAAYIKEKLNGRKPEIAITLGSGLGDLAEQLTDAVQIPYGDIPHFPISTVAGHKGQFVVGKLEGREVLCMQGRFHYYEGYDLKQVILPVRVMKLLGIETLIVTNAAGGINTGFRPGNLMLIEDHLNLTGENPHCKTCGTGRPLPCPADRIHLAGPQQLIPIVYEKIPLEDFQRDFLRQGCLGPPRSPKLTERA